MDKVKIGDVYYDRKSNDLFEIRGIGKFSYLINHYCVRAYSGSSFLISDRYDNIRVPYQSIKTSVRRAKIEPTVSTLPEKPKKYSSLLDLIENTTDKELIRELDGLSKGKVMKLAQKVHGRMYRIIKGKK